MRNCVLWRCSVLAIIYHWILLLAAQDAPTITPATASIATSENISSGNNAHEYSDSGNNDNAVNELEPSVDSSAFGNKEKQEGDAYNKQLFAEIVSQNVGVANQITNSGPPVVVTLADVAATELQQRAIFSSQTEKPPPSNQTETNDFKQEIDPRSEPNNIQQQQQQTDNNQVEASSNKENLTEEIPSFSEWAQKRLEEAEKNKEPLNTSTQHHQHTNGKQGAKLRWKNYASLDCGAKVVASNPEAVSPSAILSPSRDEYKLNTCTSRIWFIVELCEAIQAKKIDFANFELFSSSPKDFTVSVSDRFPTREWSTVGQFTAKDERDIQSFDLHPHLFGKYIKVEVKSHYGSEHYCPISLFRVYGTSEFEVLQKEDSVHADRLEEEDDDDDDESLDIENGDSSKNLFSSATDAVISMVKKAAQVLGNKGNFSNQTGSVNSSHSTPPVRVCTSPSHLVVCDNCSDTLFGRIFELLSCGQKEIRNLVQIPLIHKAVINSNICHRFGFDFKKSGENGTLNSQSSCVESFFPLHFLGAMCNTVAVLENKVVLNASNQYLNDTKKIDDVVLANIETSEPYVFPAEINVKESELTDALDLDVVETVTTSTCSTDTTQIKPTKTMTPDLEEIASTTEATNEESSSVVVTGTETVQSNLSEVPEIVNAEIINDSSPDEGETVGESVENLDDHLDHFISEFNGDSHGMPSAQTTASTAPHAQKESVFLRLSNRIKALERNMSLSGQYLEELSKRYKKQVEEMQKLLDKTILSINEENRKKDEVNKQLEERINNLTAALESLIAEKHSWSTTIYCIVVSTLVTLFVVTFCCKSPEPRSVRAKPVQVKRRKSIDVVRHSTPPKKKRRPSDQALKIVRSSMESDNHVKEKKKRKKKHLIKRSNSINTLSEEGDYKIFKPEGTSSQVWNRQTSAPSKMPDWVETKQIEEIPFALEESEHSALEPVDLPDGNIVVPNYLQTALAARQVRTSTVSSTDNGDANRKSVSLDETARILSNQPLSVNGNLSTSEGPPPTPKKERKSFKKMFKKVF